VPECPIIFDSRSRDLICVILDLMVSETGRTAYLVESQTRILDLMVSETGRTAYLVESQTRRRQFRSGHFPGSTRNGYLLRLSEIGKTTYRSLYCFIIIKAGA
jgi:hypothetical protein